MFCHYHITLHIWQTQNHPLACPGTLQWSIIASAQAVALLHGHNWLERAHYDWAVTYMPAW